MGISSPTTHSSLQSVTMAKRLCMGHGPGQQDTSFPGEREPPCPCLPDVAQHAGQSSTWSGSPFAAFPAPWWFLSAARMPGALYSASTQVLMLPHPTPWPPAHTADCSGEEPDGQLCPATRILTGELLWWAPGPRATYKLYLVFLRVGTDKCGAGKEQEMWDEHKVGEMLGLKLHSR